MKQGPFNQLSVFGLRSTLLLTGCGLFLVSILAAQAGEPIKFTPSGDGVTLPEKETKEHKIDGPIKRPSGESSDLYQLPTANPSSSSSSVLFNNKKLQELIDQRKNWIYMTPEMSMESSSLGFEKEKSNKETASELFDKGGKSKKVVERYLENQEQQNTLRGQANANKLEEEDFSMGANGKSKNSEKASNINEKGTVNSGLNNAVSESGSSSSLDLRVGGLNRKSFGYQDYATQLKMDSDQRFQQLLHPTATKGAQNDKASDPMRMLVDGTSQEMQPVTGKSLEAIASEKTKSITDPFGDPNKNAFPQSFGKVNPTVMGSSSLSPAIIAPAPASPLMAKPLVLPLPKRNF